MIQNRKAGFTLIELLVVIGIIVLLASMAIPMMHGMRERAVQTTAVSNLKGIGAALMQYASDNNGFFPLARGDIGYIANPEPDAVLSWQQQLDPYIGYTGQSTETEGTRKIFTIPSLKPTYTRWGKHAFFLGSYAARKDQDSVGFGAVNLLRIQRPSMHILAGEQGRARNYSEIDADKDDYDLNMPAFGEGKNPKRIVQILFADGHVAGFKDFDNKYMTVRYEGVKTDGEEAGLGYNYDD